MSEIWTSPDFRQLPSESTSDGLSLSIMQNMNFCFNCIQYNALANPDLGWAKGFLRSTVKWLFRKAHEVTSTAGLVQIVKNAHQARCTVTGDPSERCIEGAPGQAWTEY